MTTDRAKQIAAMFIDFVADQGDMELVYHLAERMGITEEELDELGYGRCE